MSANKSVTLPIGTILHSPEHDYYVEKVLGMGGFGITYQVQADVETSIKVGNITQQQSVKMKFAIKELFIKGCDRGSNGQTMTFASTIESDIKQSKQDFITEAKRLNKLGIKSKNIVKVNEVFEANDTAYYVMEFLDSGSLDGYIKHHGKMSWKQAKEMIVPIAKAVNMIHQEGLLHMDIKPDNIMLKHDEKGNITPVLIDFGIAKHFDESGHPTSHLMAKGASDGYAPMEQYVGIDSFAPEIDVYALSATMFYLLTAQNPPKADKIYSRNILRPLLPDTLNEEQKDALVAAMNPNKYERTPNVSTFLRNLGCLAPDENNNEENVENTNETSNNTQVIDPKERSRWVTVWIFLTLFGGILSAIIFLYLSFNTASIAKSFPLCVVSALGIVSTLGAMLLNRWRKYGLYLIIGSSAIQTILAIYIERLMLGDTSWSSIVSIPVSIVIWWKILHKEKNEVSAWDYLVDGWGYKENKRIYHIAGVISAVILLLACVPEFKESFSSNDNVDSESSLSSENSTEEALDSVAVDSEMGNEDNWKKYKDKNNYISLEAPSSFNDCTSTDQILGLEGTTNEPGIIVIRETKSSLSQLNITTAQDYANVIVDLAKETEGASNYKKVSERTFGTNSYLITYDLDIDGTTFRYNVLAKKTSQCYYNCCVYCLKESLTECESMIFRILNSFKVKEK